MKICYKRDGGLAFLPGLQRQTEFDAETLDDQRRNELSQLVSQCCFFEQPAQVGQAAKGAADMTAEVLTIEKEGARHQVRIVGTPPDEALLALLQVVRAVVALQRQHGG